VDADTACVRLRQEPGVRVRAAFAALVVLLTFYFVRRVVGARPLELWGLNLTNLVEFGATALVVGRVVWLREGRRLWLPLAVGMVSYSLGFIVYAEVVAKRHPIPYPSLSDLLWLAIYPCLFLTIARLTRPRLGGQDVGVLLDGTVAALAVAAVGGAVVFRPLLAAASGGPIAVVTNLAYPYSDVTLLALMAATMVVTGIRSLRTWLLMGAGLTVFAVSDAVYVTLATTGRYVPGGMLDAGWPAGLLLMAAAAWQPLQAATPSVGRARHLVLALPASAIVLVLLVLGSQRVGVVSTGLAAGTLVVSFVRTGYAVVAERRLQESRLQAVTDELTGLGNRRALLRQLELVFATATPHEPHALVLFDLDGFKHFNDSFGHLAGDELLTELAGRLATAVGPAGQAYRLGGDEFCVLLRGDPRSLDEKLPQLEAALGDKRHGLRIQCSYGVALLPQEASEVSAALSLADRRMYERKETQRRSTARQMRDLLLAVVEQQQPTLPGHSSNVARLCRRVGESLQLPPNRLELLVQAAELHDIGKVALPPSILEKAGPLNDAEWELMRRHTLIGETILSRVPPLAAVGAIVRSTHERFDGSGYPDGLCADAIALEARIVAACDALDAMLSHRPYRRALTRAQAEAELRRHAGTQFDPKIVTILLQVAATHGSGSQVRAAVKTAVSYPAAPEPRLTTIASLRGLLELRRIARQGASLEEVLSAAARIVADSLGLHTVVVNLRRPGSDLFEVTTVHGDPEVRASLLGSTNPEGVWQELLDQRYYRRGAYHIRAGELDWSTVGGTRAIVGELAGDDPWLWHPEDELFVPFYDSHRLLLGIFSVGEPTSRRRPSDDELDILVAIAEHAADAIEALQPPAPLHLAASY
jgi:two-component system cell cycle response regulator